MEKKDEAESRKMLLNVQTLVDAMDEASWEFQAYVQNDAPRLSGCQFYTGNEVLSEEILYLLPEEDADSFPSDRFSYVTGANRSGTAPHIQGLRRPFHEVANLILRVFQRFHDFETRLDAIFRTGGSLTDLCRAGESFFHNPMFIHDNLFALIGLPRDIAVSRQFDRNEESGIYHIPLSRIDEFRYDEEYIATLSRHDAGIWDNRAHANGFRSLYVNLWSGEQYCGRLLINERQSALKPGQRMAAEYLAEYAVMILRRDAQIMHRSYNSFEDTFIGLACGKSVPADDITTVLSILGWDSEERYLCIRLKSHDNALPISPVSAMRGELSRHLTNYYSFFYEKELCAVVNLSLSGQTPAQINQWLAPTVRDNYLSGGTSNPFMGLRLLPAAFRQAEAALAFAERPKSPVWLVPFYQCALHYFETLASESFPPELLAAPQLQKLRVYDRVHGTEYYTTLRAWLTCERKIPETSAALIIHRTTLTYRLNKIEELIPMNLDDAGLRLYLLLSYRLLDRNGSGEQGTMRSIL